MNVRMLSIVLLVGVVGGVNGMGMSECLIKMIKKHGPMVGMDENKISSYVWQLENDACSCEFHKDKQVEDANALWDEETRNNQLAIVLINPRIHRNKLEFDERFKNYGYKNFSTDKKDDFANVIKLNEIKEKDTAYRPLDGWFNKFTFNGEAIRNALKSYVVVGRMRDLNEKLLRNLRKKGDTNLNGIFEKDNSGGK